jgi:hypothetical protein
MDDKAAAKAAERSMRDDRRISTLAMLTLTIGAVLLILSFILVTFPGVTNPVLANIGPLTFRLLFCVALGLILVGLGDYAFFKVDSSFVVGGASAIALAIFVILQSAKPGEFADVAAQVVVRGKPSTDATVTLVTPESESIAATKDGAPGVDTVFLLKIKHELALRLPQQCFRIVYTGAPAFYVNGPIAQLPVTIDKLFHFVIEGNKLLRLRSDGYTDPVPPCDPSALATKDILPSASSSTVAAISNTSPPESLGWTYFGNLNSAPNIWSERVYDNQSRPKADPPQKADKIVALTDVYLRKGAIDCDGSGTCTQQPVVRVVRSGEVLSVNSVKKVMASFWVEVSNK